MKDSLKDFIEQNKAAFDHREPSDQVWQTVESSLPQMKQNSLWNSLAMWRVAAILFLGLSVYLFLSKSVSSSKNARVAVQMQREFTDQESFYSEQIAEKVAMIDDFQNTFGGDEQFTQDFQKLDAMYQVLREEMKTKPSEKVRDALILNMLVRIDLLNQQIKRLEDSGKKEKSKESSI